MTDDLIVMRLRSGLDNADKGADGVRELGGVALTMREAAARIEADAATIARLQHVANERWQERREAEARIEQQAATIARLEGERDEAMASADVYAGFNDAEAKVATLVEAMESIAKPYAADQSRLIHSEAQIASIARAAIAAAKEGA